MIQVRMYAQKVFSVNKFGSVSLMEAAISNRTLTVTDVRDGRTKKLYVRHRLSG